MSKRAVLLIGLGLLTSSVYGSGSLLYLEGQGVAGYSGMTRQAIYYSMGPDDVMQKPSAGIDYLQRLSSDNGDWGIAALQARLAYDGQGALQPQIYNCYLKSKFPWGDVWVGHDRPAFGLSSYFDTHGALLQTLAMEGFGFDRDWGGGFYKTYEDGDIGFSITTGSGMPLIAEGSYLADLRVSYGVLERDNTSLGLSLSKGSVLDIMGYRQMGGPLVDQAMAGLDAAANWLNYEFKLEAVAGTWNGQGASGVLFRAGVNLLEDNQLKLEIQPVYLHFPDSPDQWKAYGGVSYVLTDDLTLRAMDVFDAAGNTNNLIGQIYFYRRLML